MTTLKVCLLGGSGFVGRSVAARLVARGHHVHIITRRRERRRDVLVLPNVNMVEGDVHDMGVLRTQFQNRDVVINLIGILNEAGHKGKGFEQAHTDLAQKVVEACRQAKVTRLLHMSALNADPKAPSHYLRSKGLAERYVHRTAGERLPVTSFRPSVIFGPGDGFLNRFAGLLRLTPWVFPLACPDARFQPVYVEDVARAFVDAIDDHHTFGQRYNLCGPRVYTLRELVEYAAHLMGVRRRIIGLSNWQSWLQATVMEWVPGKPFSLDNYRSLQVDSVCDGPFPAVFGFEPTPLEAVAPTYLGDHGDRFSDYRRRAGRN